MAALPWVLKPKHGKPLWHKARHHANPRSPDTAQHIKEKTSVTTTPLYRLAWGMAVSSACIGASLPLAALAQPAYGRVLDATPIYEQVAIQHEACTDSTQRTRCTTTTTYEDQLVGYDVLYDYQGQQYAQRMAQHPGKRVPIQAVTPGHYSSHQRGNSASVKPGEKSYGSISPGAAAVESIEYHGKDNAPPIVIDMQMGHPPRRY